VSGLNLIFLFQQDDPSSVIVAWTSYTSESARKEKSSQASRDKNKGKDNDKDNDNDKGAKKDNEATTTKHKLTTKDKLTLTVPTLADWPTPSVELWEEPRRRTPSSIKDKRQRQESHENDYLPDLVWSSLVWSCLSVCLSVCVEPLPCGTACDSFVSVSWTEGVVWLANSSS
jgi:hypothetical protein